MRLYTTSMRILQRISRILWCIKRIKTYNIIPMRFYVADDTWFKCNYRLFVVRKHQHFIIIVVSKTMIFTKAARVSTYFIRVYRYVLFTYRFILFVVSYKSDVRVAWPGRQADERVWKKNTNIQTFICFATLD